MDTINSIIKMITSGFWGISNVFLEGIPQMGDIIISGFVQLGIPKFIMDVLDRVALAIWAFDGVIDAAFIFTALYFLTVFMTCILCFHIYKWILGLIRGS